MMEEQMSLINRKLRTPRAAALAGIAFAVLLIVSLVLIRISVPERLDGSGEWVIDHGGRIAFAIGLVPFAGIAFLWFLGVIRDRLGDYEDRFFSTVFFGSGLLFFAMTFVSAAVADSLIRIYAVDPDILIQNPIYSFNRIFMYLVSNIYGLRMAGVFMMSLGTIWVRTQVMPRLLVYLTYGLALVLLLGLNISLWLSLIFPAWVFMISVAILIFNFRKNKDIAADAMTELSSSLENTLID